LNYCNKKATPNIKNYILTHYNKKRGKIFEFIEDNNIYELKNYVGKIRDFDFIQLNDNNFNIIDYINEPINLIPLDIKIYIKNHYNKYY